MNKLAWFLIGLCIGLSLYFVWVSTQWVGVASKVDGGVLEYNTVTHETR